MGNEVEETVQGEIAQLQVYRDIEDLKKNYQSEASTAGVLK